VKTKVIICTVGKAGQPTLHTAIEEPGEFITPEPKQKDSGPKPELQRQFMEQRAAAIFIDHPDMEDFVTAFQSEVQVRADKARGFWHDLNQVKANQAWDAKFKNQEAA
jgi:hypothetical protein